MVALKKLLSTAPAMHGIPEESVSGIILFDVFVGDMNSEIKCTPSKFADDTELHAGGKGYHPE